jgi:hypothetical protein
VTGCARKTPQSSSVTELLVVAGLLLSGLSRAEARAHGVAGLNNVNQLQIAWQMCLDDHGGKLPVNYADLSTAVWRGCSTPRTGASSAPFDLDDSAIRRGGFFPLGYIRSTATFRRATHDSERQPRDGKSTGVPSSRSHSANGNLAGRPQEAQFVFDRKNLAYDPSKAPVFIDEHEDSIDDAQFLVWPNPEDHWVSQLHTCNGVLSIADDHAEQWKWKWTMQFKKQSYWKRAKSAADWADLPRLQKAIIQRAEN